MQITCRTTDGPHKRELKGLQKISEIPHYFAYSNLACLIDDSLPEYDLIIILDQFILVVEIKDYYGSIDFVGNKWIHGQRLEEDHYAKIFVKTKQLARRFRDFWRRETNSDEVPWLQHCIVFTGDLKYTEAFKEYVKEDNKKIFQLDDFCRRLNRKNSSLLHRELDIGYVVSFQLSEYKNKLDNFFGGSKYFKGKDYLYNNQYRAEPQPVYEHPDEYYSEYFAEDPKRKFYKALLRIWNFDVFPITFQGKEKKRLILSREKDAYAYINTHTTHFRDGNLLLRPESGNFDVRELEQFELFTLSKFMVPIREFISTKRLTLDDKRKIAQILLDTYERFHDIDFFHRDISEYKIWLDENLTLTITGLHTSSFPNDETVSEFRDMLLSSNIDLPEAVYGLKSMSSARMDVFQLSYIIYVIMFGKAPSNEKGTECPVWIKDNNDPVSIALDGFFSSGLDHDPDARPSNAGELKNIFLDAKPNLQGVTENKVDRFSRFRFKGHISQRFQNADKVKIIDNYGVLKRLHNKQETFIKYIMLGENISESDLIHVDRNLFNIETLYSVCHKVAPALISHGIDQENTLFMETEAVEGIKLNLFLEKPNIDLSKFNNATTNLLNDIKLLASKGIIHNDIKNEHVFIDEEYSIKVIDWFDFQYFNQRHGSRLGLDLEYANLDCTTRSATLWSNYFVGLFKELKCTTKKAQDFFSKIASRIEDELENQHIPLTHETLITILSDHLVHQAETVVCARPVFSNVMMPLVEDKFIIDVQDNKKHDKELIVKVVGHEYYLLIYTDKTGKYESNAPLIQGKLDAKELNVYLSQENKKKYPLYLKSNKLVLRPDGSDKPFQGAIIDYVEKLKKVVKDKRKSSEQVDSRTLEEDWIQSLEREREETEFNVDFKRIKYETIGNDQIELTFNEYDYTDFLGLEEEEVELSICNRRTGFKISGSINTTNKKSNKVFAVFDGLEKVFNQRFKPEDWLLNNRNALSYSSYLKQKNAIDNILGDNAPIESLKDYFSGEKKSPHFQERNLNRNGYEMYNFNDEQCHALELIMGGSPLSLVQGPPGTGKTYFIGSLIHHVLKTGIARNILLVSQTHIAIDNALKKAKSIHDQSSENLDAIRLGKQDKIDPLTKYFHTSSHGERRYNEFKSCARNNIYKILKDKYGLDRNYIYDLISVCEDFIPFISRKADKVNEEDGLYIRKKYGLDEDIGYVEFFQKKLKTLRDTHKIRNRKIENTCTELIKVSLEYQVSIKNDNIFEPFMVKTKKLVCGTCVGIHTKKSDFETTLFDLVIIDEAARATSGQLAIPMLHGKKIVLVGDHKQLPPQVSLNANIDGGYLSDFEFLIKQKDNMNSVLLKEQYRMVPEISNMVSDLFYEGKLIAKRDDCEQYPPIGDFIFNNSIGWVDTTGDYATVERKTARSSYENKGEARAIIRFLKLLNASEKFLESKMPHEKNLIGIICAYSAQVELINSLLAQESWDFDYSRLIKVGTVDSYQGEENKIILLSLTRSNTQNKTGFTEAIERINVSISRAMDHLYIFGSTKFWLNVGDHQPVKKVLKYIKDKHPSSLISTGELFT